MYCKQVDSIPEFIDAIRLRVQTFIIEQNCKPGWEPDEFDKSCIHYIGIIDENVVATLRVNSSIDRIYKIERMVTAKEFRKKGAGKELLKFVVEKISIQKPEKIWMQAQVQAMAFYEQCGFKAVSKEYDLWGIPHIDMEYI